MLLCSSVMSFALDWSTAVYSLLGLGLLKVLIVRDMLLLLLDDGMAWLMIPDRVPATPGPRNAATRSMAHEVDVMACNLLLAQRTTTRLDRIAS